MRSIGNLLWLFSADMDGPGMVAYRPVAYVSIVGIPWGKACFVIGQFTFFPFGKEQSVEMSLHEGSILGPEPWGCRKRYLVRRCRHLAGYRTRVFGSA